MKKTLITLGTISAIAIAPMSVVSCLSNKDKETGNHYPSHYNGGGYYTGPRGGTYHYTKSGHRSYSGHTSHYH